MPTEALNMETAVSDLKRGVTNAVSACLRTFYGQTGVHPSEMRLRIEETTELGDTVRHYVFAGVELEFIL